jgi:hypothetical protein
MTGWVVPAPWKATEVASKPDPMADPRVTALVDALRHYACDCGGDMCERLNGTCGDSARAALAAFNTGGKVDDN